MSWTSVVNAAKPNACSDRETGTIRKEIWNRRISDCERIPCVHDWDTGAPGTKPPLEWIGRRWHSCQGRVEKRARIFEVGKYRQVLVAQVAGERTVEHLTVSWRQRGRNSREVIAEVVATSTVFRPSLVKLHSRIVDTRRTWICIGINLKGVFIKWRSRRIWCRMRKGRVHAGQRETARA